jgi:regulator of sigma D
MEKDKKTINDLQNITQKTKDWADRQYNGRMDKDKKTINNLQNTTQKTKDWVDGQYNGQRKRTRDN